LIKKTKTKTKFNLGVLITKRGLRVLALATKNEGSRLAITMCTNNISRVLGGFK
jgi:hypothetical protein